MQTAMPVLFAGHGSPMNAIENNPYSRGFETMGAALPRPKAILAISAHWVTPGVSVRTAPDNPQINDMYGFPQALYDVHYTPAGDPALARRLMDLAGGAVTENNDWGIDHGIWSILCRMFPKADIPVVMMSTPARMDAAAYMDLCRPLSALSAEGVLILASGNVVHNLRLIDWENKGGAPWAYDFDHAIRDAVTSSDEAALLRFASHPAYLKSAPTAEHFYPLLAAFGAAGGKKASVWNEGCLMNSLSMTSYLFQ